MPRNFYYGKDADIVAGSANFAALMSASATTYGATVAQAAAFALLNTALQSAYSESSSPTTRSPVAIESKNQAIANMRVSAINLAKIAYSTVTVTDSDLIALGLLPRPTRTPIPAPATAPTIDVVQVTGNTVRIRLHDETNPTRRGKPEGVDGASVFSFIGAAPATEESEWTFEGVTSKTVVNVTFPSETAPGAKVWFTAFWFNERKQSGPAATAVGCNLPGGAAMAA